MSFFVTSRPAGEGGDLGGLAGADAHCKRLAEAAGSTGKTWRAYLSRSEEGGNPAVDARDRIGSGPWLYSRGDQIAANLEDLHASSNNCRLRTVLPESGKAFVSARHPDRVGPGWHTCRWRHDMP